MKVQKILDTIDLAWPANQLHSTPCIEVIVSEAFCMTDGGKKTSVTSRQKGRAGNGSEVVIYFVQPL
jgi:hypothetical protein